MKSSIIKDFDQFKEVNESDMSLLSWLAGQAGDQIGKAAKERATSMVLDYMGIPADDPNNPETRGQWLREIFVKIIGGLSFEEMDEILLGDGFSVDFWVPKIAHALKEQIIDMGKPSAGMVCNFLGVSSEGFIGRLITNMYREYILDEKKLEQTIRGLWRLVATQEFIPQEDAGEIYKEAYSKLTPAQKEKLEGSVWKSSVKNMDFLKRKGG
jgi:hypothetical protein